MTSTREQIALNELAKKIRLESRLKRKMHKLFRKISKDLRSQFVISGTVLNANTYKNEIAETLRDHYDRVFKSFNNVVINEIKSYKNGEEFKQVEENIVDRENERFKNSQSETQSQKITDTNQKRINAAIAAALLAFRQESLVEPSTESERLLARKKIASGASQKFLSDAESRAEATAITETQNPAETAKNNQINALSITGAISSFGVRKVWTAILDNRVRDAHAIADGQVRKIGEPYEVNGELLKHPGDTSLGASAGNVINCRCSSSLQFLGLNTGINL